VVWDSRLTVPVRGNLRLLLAEGNEILNVSAPPRHIFFKHLARDQCGIGDMAYFLNLIRVDEGCNALDDAKMDRLKKG
jgi:hypothetical protein